MAGTYFIKVENVFPFGGLQVGVVPNGVDYELNVSIENHEVDGFLFAPAPVFENEAQQALTGFEDIDARENFFTFFDPTVGTRDFVNEGDPFVDFQTPYARIQGEGDGTIDIFQFTIANEMLIPLAGDVDAGSTLDPNGPYYTTFGFQLDGTVEEGDVYTLGLRYRDYTYIGGQDSDPLTLAAVADGLRDAIVNGSSEFSRIRFGPLARSRRRSSVTRSVEGSRSRP